MRANNICGRFISYLLMQKNSLINSNYQCYIRNIKSRAVLYCNKYSNQTKVLVKTDCFENVSDKNKNSYLDMVKIFYNRDIHRRGHVEFIYSALRNMESFSVHKDLEVYKSLIDVLPKGKFIPTNIFQAEFMHYPKQQQCAIDLLQQMEDNGVMPDLEMEDMLVNIFGRRGYPLRKYWRMMYWMPKFKNLSPWPLPKILPNDSLELAKIAIARMTSVDLQTEMTVYQSADIAESIDDTWIVSAQSPTQRELLDRHNIQKPVYVEGSFRIWLQSESVNYFILRTDNNETVKSLVEDPDDVSHIRVPSFKIPQAESAVSKVPTLHEQEDGIILAICATGTSSRDSLLSWVRHLEKSGNHILSKAPVVFSVQSPATTDIPPITTLNAESSGEMSMIENEK